MLCEICGTEPIWLAVELRNWWTVSRSPFSDETSAAKFAADVEGVAFNWTHVLNFATKKLTSVTAYGFRSARKKWVGK
jgi:hypothetical protein